MRHVSRSQRVLAASLVVAAATVTLAAAAAYVVRKKQRVATAAVRTIESELAKLDPPTRALVMARVGAAQAKRIRRN